MPTPKKFPPYLLQLFEHCLLLVLKMNRFWPTERIMQLVHSIIPASATEVAVVKDGKLLLQFRTFAEWRKPYDRPGWYIPGGYITWGATLGDSCSRHLEKDLVSEYKRSGIDGGDLSIIKLAPPVVIGVKKWMPGEHVFGCPVSLVCVCELTQGHIVETEWLKWLDAPVATDVPHHHKFQEMVFSWLKSTPEQRSWLKGLHAIVE